LHLFIPTECQSVRSDLRVPDMLVPQQKFDLSCLTEATQLSREDSGDRNV